MIRGRTRRARGSMMLEVVFASALSVIVIALLVSAQISVLRNYQRTIDHNTANRGAYNALREVRELAQQAASVTVSGNIANIILPRRDANGRFMTPIQADIANPVRLEVNFGRGELTLTQGAQTRTLLTNIVNTTPQGTTYSPFAAQQIAPGIVALHIRLSVRQGQGANAQRVWYEETILLRNATRN